MSYDFGGWATRFNIKCADGRTILPDAFKECDGQTVPIVWNHKHGEANNVLGHALLENRDDGVYCYGTFNHNPEGEGAKELVRNGDITSLSIYANGLKHVNGRNVQHGVIREVSLVLAGANPGAYIDDVICHSDDDRDDGAVIYSGMDFDEITLEHNDDEYELEHAENQNGETAMDIYNSLNEKQKSLFAYIVMKLSENEDVKHSIDDIDVTQLSDEELDEMIHALEMDDGMCHSIEDIDVSQLSDEALDDMIDILEHSNTNDNGETVADVYNAMTDKQKLVVQLLLGTVAEKYESEDNKMTHNVFENQGDYIAHAQIESQAMFKEALADMKNYGSLKESVLAHGVEDIDLLFPEYKSLDNEIDFVTRNTDWVKVFMDRTRKSAFARTKSLYGDLTGDDARARGYIKGRFKKEQVFSLLKRTTDPTTIYKKQKVDKDDLIDISGGNYDLITILNKEMRSQLDEEIARAALVGDGRPTSSEDKIDPLKIRPIWTDEDFYTIKYVLPDETPRAFIEGAVRSRVDYKGSGNPTLFITEQSLTELLLLTDSTGRDLYDSVDKLATKLRVRDIVTVPVMENLVRVDTKTGKAYKLHGIIVNLTDYNVGTDRGGQIKWYDQFDIDYNAQKYLIETRCSGALVKPFSAIVLETETTAPAEDEVDNG